MTRSPSPWQKVVGVLGLVVVFWVGDRLYDVIDSGGGGSGADHGPSSPTSTTQPTAEGEEPTPGEGTTGAHDPSQFDH